MSISISCPTCGKNLRIKEELSGKKIKCPYCKSSMRVANLEIEDSDAESTPPPLPKKSVPASTPDKLDNSSTQFEESEIKYVSPNEKVAKKWEGLGKPLFWNGLARIGYGSILLFIVLIGFILTLSRTNASNKLMEDENRKRQAEAQSLTDSKKVATGKQATPASKDDKNNTALANKNIEVTPAESSGIIAIGESCTKAPLMLMAVILGIFYIFRGLMMVLQPIFVPSDAPSGINHPTKHRKNVLPILEGLPNDHLYLGTYEQPKGLAQLILHAFSPDSSYLTPPIRRIAPSTSILVGLMLSCVTFLCVKMSGGWGLLLIPLSILFYIAVCITAISLCKPSRPSVPEVIQHDVTRIDLGNPQSLFEKLRHDGLDEIRSPLQRMNRNDRMLFDTGDTGRKKAAIGFNWWICLESEPIIMKGNVQFPRVASFLEISSLIFCLFGAILTFTLPIENYWGLLIAGIVILLLAIDFVNKAYNIRNTFRWKSDLFAITANGTMQRQRAGGEDVNFQIERFHSQIHLTVLGTRVITECSSPSVWKPKLGDLKHALNSPRYLIETCIEDELRIKIQSILSMLEQFHDREGVVMGAEEDSVGAKELQKNKAEREQQKVALALQQQMQIMLFGKILDKMTPEQLQQMMLKGGTMPLPLPADRFPPEDGKGTSSMPKPDDK